MVLHLAWKLVRAVIVVGFVKLLKILFTKCRNWWKIRQNLNAVWSGPDYNWFFGHLPQVNKAGGLMNYLIGQVPKYPCAHSFHLGPFVSLLRVNCPHMAKEILSSSNFEFPKWVRSIVSKSVSVARIRFVDVGRERVETT